MVACGGGPGREGRYVSDKFRVLLVEDSDMYRQGLRAFLESVGEIDIDGHARVIEVVKEATNRAEAVQSAIALRPDLVVMDLRLPDLAGVVKAQEGLSAIQQVTTADPTVKVLVVTMKREERWARKAMDAGAKGYVVKDADDSRCHVLLAIRTVASGGAFVSRAAASQLPHLIHDQAFDVPALFREFSRTHIQILQLALQGLENEEIATRLDLRLHTIRTRLSEMKSRLHVGERRLLHLAREHGLDAREPPEAGGSKDDGEVR
jgi:DNA-binding NarL/FixJ family response regulator